MKDSWILSIFTFLGVILLCGTMYAQSEKKYSGAVPSANDVISSDNSSVEPTVPTARSKQTIRDLLPLYLTEKNGNLVPALNWTPQELDEIVAQAEQNQHQNQLPDYICERLTMTGVQKEDSVEMDLTLMFTVPEKPIVKIPLQINGIILIEPPQCGPNEFLAPQADGGYILYLKHVKQEEKKEDKKDSEEKPADEKKAEEKPEEKPAEEKPAEEKPAEEKPAEEKPAEEKPAEEKPAEEKPAEEKPANETEQKQSDVQESHSHQITLKIRVPLKKTYSSYSMNLRLPKALYSMIALDVPYSSSDLHISSSAATTDAPESINENKETRLKAYSLGTDFQMQWQKQTAVQTENRIQEVWSDVYVDIRHSEILYSVNMQMLFSGTTPKSVAIKLPQSAELIPTTTPQYTVQRPEKSSDDNLAIVTFNENTFNSAKVTFQARVPLNKLNLHEWFNLMGFEVQDAVKQSGCLGITSDKENQILWNPGQYVRRVDDLPETFEGSYQYAFQFSEQPGSLLVRFVSGQTQMNVQPRYIVTVNAEEIKLEASWKYNIRGTQTSWLDIDLQGWQLRTTKDIGPENSFTSETQEDKGRVSVHLASPQSDLTDMTMTLYRKIKPDDKEISFTLPRPVSNSPQEEISIEPGLLYIISATNVKLTPQSDTLDAFTKQLFTSLDEQYSKANETFCYRLDVNRAEFKAGMSVHKRQIDLENSRNITISGTTARVEQLFNFSVQYEPLTQIVFSGPDSLAECTHLEVSMNGKPLAIRTVPSKEQTKIIAILDEPQIGNFTLNVSYDIAFDKTASEVKFVIPFAKYENLDGTVISSTDSPLLLGLERVWELEQLNRPWKLETANEVNTIIDSNKFNVTNEDSPFDSPAPATQTAQNPTKDEQKTSKTEERKSKEVLNYMLLDWEQHSSNNTVKAENSTKDSVTKLPTPQSDLPQSLMFSITQRPGMVWNTLTINRAWIQTWLTDSRRQDAACFKFTSPHPQLTVCLPTRTDMGSLEILLDGTVVERFRLDSGQKIILTVPTDQNEHTLEISYYFNRAKKGFDKEEIELPYIKESKWTRWFYWSISVPQNIHLLTPPNQLNSEYTWLRQGPFFRRVAVHSFESLEQWSGGQHLPSPPQGVNIYLFSGFGPVHKVELTLMNRTVLVFVTSLIILVPGLILIHFKRLRQSWILTLIAILLVIASFWEPELALVFLQASALGITLLALSFLFRKKQPNVTVVNDSTVFQPHTNNSQVK